MRISPAVLPPVPENLPRKVEHSEQRYLAKGIIRSRNAAWNPAVSPLNEFLNLKATVELPNLG
jgi:hypothetical protein